MAVLPEAFDDRPEEEKLFGGHEVEPEPHREIRSPGT
jgi:hypothetical protein